MREEATRVLTKSILAAALMSTAAGMSGCPLTYEVQIGNWILHQTPFPQHITFGLTLEADGDAIPYEETAGYGALPGTWSWATNGHNIWFTQNNNGTFYTYYGELLSETSAYGEIYEGSYDGNTDRAIGSWEAARDPS
jgi:hypothetical protein